MTPPKLEMMKHLPSGTLRNGLKFDAVGKTGDNRCSSNLGSTELTWGSKLLRLKTKAGNLLIKV